MWRAPEAGRDWAAGGKATIAMEALAQGCLSVGMFTMLALLGFAVVQRVVPLDVREPLNDVAGFIYAVVGVLYTVLLAFVVVIAWQHFDAAGTTVQDEANQVAGIYGLTQQFTAGERSQIQGDLLRYVNAVIDQEWPLMGAGKSSPEATSAESALRGDIEGLKPMDAASQNLDAQALNEFHQLENDRRQRLLESRDALPPIMWFILQAGGVITVGYTYIFGLKNTTAHALLIATLTVGVVAILYLVQAVELPFSGSIRVEPDSFEAAIQAFQGL